MLDKNLSVKDFLEYYGVVTEEECTDNYGEPGADFKKGLEYLQKKRPPSGVGKANDNIYHSYVAILVMLRWLYIKPIEEIRKNFSMIPNRLTDSKKSDVSGPCGNYTFGDTPDQPDAVFIRLHYNESKNNKELKPKDCYPIVLGVYHDPDVPVSVAVEKLTYQSTVAQVIHQLWEFVRADKRQGFRSYVEEEFGINLDGSPIREQCKTMVEAGVHQIVFTGAPGTGKTYTAEHFAEETVRKQCGGTLTEADRKKYICKVQFHASYDYTDFVEGLRPVMQKGQMVFVRMDGQLKSFCRKILQNREKDKKYFFLIDEINRADLSRVFGELMYCLDEENRGSEHRVTTQYANLPTYAPDGEGVLSPLSSWEDVFWDGFYLPENLYILATMNDIDRSVEAFDFALRRRFKWIAADASTEAREAMRDMLIHERAKQLLRQAEASAPSEEAQAHQAEASAPSEEAQAQQEQQARLRRLTRELRELAAQLPMEQEAGDPGAEEEPAEAARILEEVRKLKEQPPTEESLQKELQRLKEWLAQVNGEKNWSAKKALGAMAQEISKALAALTENTAPGAKKNPSQEAQKEAAHKQAKAEIDKIDKEIQSLLQRLEEMNKVISGEKGKGKALGLSQDYHIGHAYFKDYYKEGKDNLLEIWDSQICPILREYCRGKNAAAVESFLADCRNALGVPNPPVSESKN